MGPRNKQHAWGGTGTLLTQSVLEASGADTAPVRVTVALLRSYFVFLQQVSQQPL
jgi:hypothetical protein